MSQPNPPRPSPFDLVFGGEFEEAFFPEIRAEADSRGVESSDRDRFPLLVSVGRLLREIVPEGADKEAFREAATLVFHAYHFWRFGRRVFSFSEPLGRWLADDAPTVGEWELTPPFPGGYVQLPRHLFWARVEQEAPAEPLDGFFWTMVGAEDPATPPYHRLDALLVLGLRADRPGFSVIELAQPIEGSPGHWADLEAREAGPAFANVLPGGESQGFRSVTTEAEALKLVSLCFWYVAAHPEALSTEPPPGDGRPAVQRVDLVEDRG